jgi:hypothetical protein
MMHPYQLHTLSKHYHEEALKEAQVRNLRQQAKEHSRASSEGQGIWPRPSKLAAAFGSS